MFRIIEGIPLWLTIYLGINLVMSIIAWCIIERADKYWSKHEDANLSLVSSMIIYPSFISLKYIAYAHGYIVGFFSLLTRTDSSENLRKLRETREFVSDLVNALILVLFWIPLFIYTIYFEIKCRMEIDGDE